MPQFRPLSQTKFINDANLVAYYKLEDTSDSKGSYTLTNNNSVAFNAAKFNNGADFGTFGNTKSLRTSNTLGIDGGNVTFCAWVKKNITLNSKYYYAAYQENNASKVEYKLGFDKADGTEKMLFCRGKVGVADNNAYYTVTLDTNWHFLTGTYDGTTAKLYLDGAFVGSVASSGNGTNGSVYTSGFSIGNNNNNSSFIENGLSVDDTAIFSRALSASEVNELYQGMTLGEYLPNSNTKLLLHLNGNSTDSSGNGNNGTDTAITYSQANGRFGQGAGFNGTTSKIVNSMSYVPTNKTISIWFKTSVNNAYQELFSQNRWVSASNYDTQEFRLTNSGKISYTEANNAFNSSLISAASYPTSSWVNVVVTTSGTSWKLYVNGTNTDNATLTNISNFTVDTNGTVIGAYAGQPSPVFFFNGSIDEVKIDNYAWTPQQVAKYYSYAKGGFGII